jgi:drug/metabolite transporter (DMT)-like permease
VDAIDLAIVLLSALLHAGWSVAIKGSRDALVFNLLQTVLAGGVGLAVLAFIEPAEIPASLWPIVAGTGVAHGLYLYWLSRALADADISLVYPIARSTPAFLPLVAVPLLGESISVLGALGIGTVVAGMWLVNLGPELRWRAFFQPGVTFAYLTLATTVAYGLFDKAAMVELDAATWTSPIARPVFYFFLLYLACALVHLPLCVWRLRELGVGWSPIREVAHSEWRSLLVALGIGFAGYALILEALRSAPASYVVAVRQSSVFFVLALSVLRLGERPGRQRVAGAALTVAGVVLIALAP